MQVTELMDPHSNESKKCIFSSRSQNNRSSGLQVDLSEVLDESILQLRTSTPQEIVVGLFQKLVSSYLPDVCSHH
jgi:hypothetical protein